jgi:hypothetical protein
MEEELAAPSVPFSERLKRRGNSWESKSRLMRKAEEAERLIGIHGVSVTAGMVKGACSEADRHVIAQHFVVHDTPTRSDRLHRTVELPKPLTDEVVETFNRLFGRARTTT